MSILKDFARKDYLHEVTEAANDLLEKYWDEQKKMDTANGHPIHVGDAPRISHAEAAAVIDVIESAQQSGQEDSRWDCPNCDVRHIKGYYTECPECGTPQPGTPYNS